MTIRLLVAVDGSDNALLAVHHAMALCRHGLRAEVVVLQVQEEASFLQLATQDPDAIAQAAVEAGEHLMAPAIGLLTQAGIDWTQEVAVGEPAPTIVDMAERLQCDQIIMGARGVSGLAAWMGSVSQSVLKQSHVPVTIVKPPLESAEEVLGENEEE